MGGRHTQFVGFKNLDLFASFGVLSAGDPDTEKVSASFLNDPQVTKKVRYLFVGQGIDEVNAPIGARCVALHKALEAHSIPHEYYITQTGAHEWTTWRQLLHDRFLPGLFRGK